MAWSRFSEIVSLLSITLMSLLSISLTSSFEISLTPVWSTGLLHHCIPLLHINYERWKIGLINLWTLDFGLLEGWVSQFLFYVQGVQKWRVGVVVGFSDSWEMRHVANVLFLFQTQFCVWLSVLMCFAWTRCKLWAVCTIARWDKVV